MTSEKAIGQPVQALPEAQSCLFAQTGNPGMVVGVVSAAEPSSLALLAAGVAGMAARRVRRERAKAPGPAAS